jgi:hypothetical protein
MKTDRGMHMWDLVSNPVITHLAAFGIGAALAWYATHKTAVQAVAAAVKVDAATVDASLKKIV